MLLFHAKLYAWLKNKLLVLKTSYTSSCLPKPQRVSKEPMPEKKLFLIPCCASKKHNGHSRSAVPEPLSRLVSEAIYSGILKTRREVLSGIRQDKRYLSGKYEKNRRLEPGPDFGGQSASGLYLPAVQRYRGTLYSNVPALSSRSNRGMTGFSSCRHSTDRCTPSAAFRTTTCR